MRTDIFGDEHLSTGVDTTSWHIAYNTWIGCPLVALLVVHYRTFLERTDLYGTLSNENATVQPRRGSSYLPAERSKCSRQAAQYRGQQSSETQLPIGTPI